MSRSKAPFRNEFHGAMHNIRMYRLVCSLRRPPSITAPPDWSHVLMEMEVEERRGVWRGERRTKMEEKRFGLIPKW